MNNNATLHSYAIGTSNMRQGGEHFTRACCVCVSRGGGMFLFFFIPLSMDHSIIHEWKRIEAQEVGVGENGLVKECFGLTSLDEAAKCNPN